VHTRARFRRVFAHLVMSALRADDRRPTGRPHRRQMAGRCLQSCPDCRSDRRVVVARESRAAIHRAACTWRPGSTAIRAPRHRSIGAIARGDVTILARRALRALRVGGASKGPQGRGTLSNRIRRTRDRRPPCGTLTNCRIYRVTEEWRAAEDIRDWR